MAAMRAICSPTAASRKHWYSLKASLPPEGVWLQARIRYRAAPALALARPLADGRARLEFAHPQCAIAPGQAVVCYRGETVAFGGKIAAIRKPTKEEKWQLSLQ